MTITINPPSLPNATGCIAALVWRLKVQKYIFFALCVWAAMSPLGMVVTNTAYRVVNAFISIEGHPFLSIVVAALLGLFYVAVLLSLMYYVPLRMGPKTSEIYMSLINELYALQDFLDYQIDEKLYKDDRERLMMEKKVIDIGLVIAKVPTCATTTNRLCGCTLTRDHLNELVQVAQGYLIDNHPQKETFVPPGSLLAVGM
jgi:hypothetical protein